MKASPTAAAAGSAVNRKTERDTNSAAALHKASSTFGLKTTASASRLLDQYEPPSPLRKDAKKQQKKEDAAGVGGDAKRPATYANMAVEVRGANLRWRCLVDVGDKKLDEKEDMGSSGGWVWLS